MVEDHQLGLPVINFDAVGGDVATIDVHAETCSLLSARQCYGSLGGKVADEDSIGEILAAILAPCRGAPVCADGLVILGGRDLIEDVNVSDAWGDVCGEFKRKCN